MAVILALVTALVLGLKHGIDYDHIAAISDLTSAPASKKESISLSLLYALGHGTVIAILGLLAVLAGLRLPSGTDSLMERFVGATLVLLGLYVFYSLLLRPGTAKIKTRITILSNLALKLHAWFVTVVSGRPHEHKEVFSDGYGTKSAFIVGMIHGIGAETPTQIVLFVLAGGMGGVVLGASAVFAFILGLLMMNTLMAMVFTYGYSISQMRPVLFKGAMVLTGVYSLAMGVILLCGLINILPPLS